MTQETKKSVKQEAYNFFKKYLADNRVLYILGYDKNYCVLDIAVDNSQLKELLKTKGIAGAIMVSEEGCHVGFNFITGEHYRKGLTTGIDAREYYGKEKKVTYLNNSNPEEVIIDSNKFILPFSEFLEQFDVSFGEGSEPIVSGSQPLYSLTIKTGGGSISMTKHKTVYSTTDSNLIIQDYSRDIDYDLFSKILGRALNIDEQKMKEGLITCMSNDDLSKWFN